MLVQCFSVRKVIPLTSDIPSTCVFRGPPIWIIILITGLSGPEELTYAVACLISFKSPLLTRCMFLEMDKIGLD